MENLPLGIFYQFVCCRFAILVSVDWRCASGHTVHLKLLQFDPRDVVWC